LRSTAEDGDLDVGGFAMSTGEVQRLYEVALASNELVEGDDTRHVAGEDDDADTHSVVVDAETD